MSNLVRSENKQDDYLRISSLSEGITASSLAFLVDVRKLPDRNGNPYLTFLFRTADNCVISGKKFRIESSVDMGDEILAVKKTVVNINYQVQIYRGEFSLLINSIRIHEGFVDPSIFFNAYPNIDEIYKTLCDSANSFGADIPSPLYKTMSLVTVVSGKVGGVLAIMERAQIFLSSNKSQSFYAELMTIFYAVFPVYVEYRRVLDKIDFVPKNELLTLISNITKSDNYRRNAISGDVISALVNLGQPEHLIAHLIVHAIKSAETELIMFEKVQRSPKNTVIDHDGSRLTFY